MPYFDLQKNCFLLKKKLGGQLGGQLDGQLYVFTVQS